MFLHIRGGLTYGNCEELIALEYLKCGDHPQVHIVNCGCAEEKLDLLFKFREENEELLLHEVDFEVVVIRE